MGKNGEVLLMVKKSQGQPPFGCTKPYKYGYIGISTKSTGAGWDVKNQVIWGGGTTKKFGCEIVEFFKKVGCKWGAFLHRRKAPNLLYR